MEIDYHKKTLATRKTVMKLVADAIALALAMSMA